MNSALWARATSLIFIFIIAVLTAPAILPSTHTILPKETSTFQGRVLVNDLYLDKQRLIIVIEDHEQLKGFKAFVYTRRYPVYVVGEHVEISCLLREPEAFDGFAFDRYAQRHSISAQCFYPRIRTLSESEHKIGKLSYAISQRLRRTFKEPSSSVLHAITLRQTHELPDALRNIFSQAGVAHVLAISGLHIGLLILLLDEFLILFRIYPKARLLIIFTIITGYLLLISFPASAIRATIMATALLLSRATGRTYDGMHILLISAALMLAWNPLLFWYDIGFQLSFLSIAGILLTFQLWERLLFVVTHKTIRSLVSLTMSAQTFTWPLVAYYFDTISIISPLTNLIVVPLASLVLFGSIISILLSATTLLSLVAIPVDFIIYIIVEVSTFFTRMPYSYVTIEMDETVLCCTLCITVASVFVLRKKIA